MIFPGQIAKVVGSAPYQEEDIGMSGARVLMFEDHVLKIRSTEDYNTADVKILEWIEAKHPGKVLVPRVAAHQVEDGKDYLLMTRTRGLMLCDPSIMEKPTLLMDLMAEGLHQLWSVPTEDCPFPMSVKTNLDHAEEAIRNGTFEPDACMPETFGPGGFESPAALATWLREHEPPLDPVLSHGDYCLPNLFTDGSHLTGMIDVGFMGVADRWRDLAIGWRSLLHNSNGWYGYYPDVHPDDLFRAVGIPKDEEKLRYYLLLDELN